MRGVILALALLASTSGLALAESADLILSGGKIVAVDDQFSIHEAIVIRGDKIVAVGRNDLMEKFDAKRVIDLRGKMVIPGFNDTHTHISGNATRHIILTGVKSIVQLKQLVRGKARELGEGEWITGYGWSEDTLVEKRRPLRSDLDAAAPRNPVILTRQGGHSAVVNSLALKLADVTRDTPNPESGVIERDKRGELNGIIRESQGIVGRLVPRATADELRPSFVRNLRDLSRLGITSIIQAGVWPLGYAEWQRVYREHPGELPRAAVQVRWGGAERMKSFGKKTGDGDEWLRVGALKVFVDGGFTGPGAYTIAPYRGRPNDRGKLRRPKEQLRAIIHEAHPMGWQMGFHAIGDGAIQIAVELFVEALESSPRGNHRHYLNHFTVMPPVETMRLMAKHRILIAQQPNFTYSLEGRYVDYLDGERLQKNNPLRTPMGHGIFMALGADIYPTGPLIGIYAAVTRKGSSGAVYGSGERLTMKEAIRGYTRNGAYLTFEEEIKGTLEPGKLADMVILSHDLLTIDPSRIMDVQVEKTILGGKIIFDRAVKASRSNSRR